jgi:hypothetical protein
MVRLLFILCFFFFKEYFYISKLFNKGNFIKNKDFNKEDENVKYDDEEDENDDLKLPSKRIKNRIELNVNNNDDIMMMMLPDNSISLNQSNQNAYTATTSCDKQLDEQQVVEDELLTVTNFVGTQQKMTRPRPTKPHEIFDYICEMKRDLLNSIKQLGKRLPANTLDELIDLLDGPDHVAEMSKLFTNKPINIIRYFLFHHSFLNK